MNAKQLQKYLLHLCLCVVACAYAALTLAADDAGSMPAELELAAASDAAVQAALKGRWEGTLDGAFRSQDVSWHFEVDDDGKLRGFMGPSNAGMPDRPMEDLVVSAGLVSFTLGSQHASFNGTITPDGIAGNWHQGSPLPLRMRKKNFVFPLSAAVRAALVGTWELENGGGTTQVTFSESDGGTLVGFLSTPGIDLHDAPLVDIFVTEEGYAQFATDNGRRFTGRLANGVLVGEYASGERRYRRNFLRLGDARTTYDLALSATARDRMLGRWHAEVRGDDVILEVALAADNSTQARLLFDEGPRRRDELLELTVDGDTVSYTTFGGRTFNGSFNADGIAGDYFSGSRPSGVLYRREAK
ncbi:MAG TPA: hypothetical protein VGE69_14595 [Pseudomonadales bacterium]